MIAKFKSVNGLISILLEYCNKDNVDDMGDIDLCLMDMYQKNLITHDEKEDIENKMNEVIKNRY